MPWSLPDKGEGVADIQSVVFQEYLELLVDGIEGKTCVLSGCVVTGGADMTPEVTKGAVLSAGVLYAVTAGTFTIGTADATHPRIDLLVIDSSGAKQTRAGTAAANPKPPVRTANDVVLAAVYVPANDTAIATNQITDLRVIVARAVVKKVTAPTATNSTTSPVNVFTVTFPSGLFLAGRVARVRLGGNFQANSGTPTFTLTISFGGTTMFLDVTSTGFSADADRRAWRVEFDLVAQADNDQAINGFYALEQAAAKTQATNGQGDIGSQAQQVGPFNGAAAVDADAGDRTLDVTWTMSVSNSANEVLVEFATAELL